MSEACSKSLIPEDWQVPEVFRFRMGEEIGRQRTMHADGHLLIALHKVPAPGEFDREGILFWRNAEGNWFCNEGGNALAVLDEMLDQYEERIGRIAEAFKLAQAPSEFFELLKHLTPVSRAIRNGTAALQAAHDHAREDRELLDLKDYAHELDRSADLLYLDSKNGLDFALARKAEEQAMHAEEMTRAAHRLNLLVAMFLPMTALASVFGMNLASGLNIDKVTNFYIVVGMGAVCGFILLGMLYSAKMSPIEKAQKLASKSLDTVLETEIIPRRK